MDDRLQESLRTVRVRYQCLRWLRTTAGAAVLVSLVMLGLWLGVPSLALSGLQWLALAALGSLAILGISSLIALASYRQPRWIAQQVERANPVLGQRLLAALDQHPDASGRLSYLQRHVIDEVLAYARTPAWAETVPSGRLMRASVAAIAAWVLVIVSLFCLGWLPPQRARGFLRSGAGELQAGLTVEPGDLEVERGTSLVVTARFSEDSTPARVRLVRIEADAEQRFEMKRNLDDPLFGGFLPSIEADLQYRVETENLASPTYKIRVFDFPRMVRSDAQIESPEYTGLPLKTIEDTVRVTFVEGAQLTWSIHVNKPLASAVLVDGSGQEVSLRNVPDRPTLWTATLRPQRDTEWTLQLVDSEGRTNKFPPELMAQVLPNQPPTLKLLTASDAVVSPLEEWPVAATAADDFGLRRAGVSFSLGAGEPREIELMSATAEPGTATLAESDLAAERAPTGQLHHTVDLEALGAQPDQLLSYHFWAEDTDSAGRVRRTTSDMFFAEVRPFEQIFREGNSPPAESGSPAGAQAQQAEQLAELQKQIVTAIWNLTRRADLAGASGRTTLQPPHVEDARAILESQRVAIGQLEGLTENLPPDRSPELVEAVERYMRETVLHLEEAIGGQSQPPLSPALLAARGAYEAMLHLRAREFDVVRSGQSSSSGGSAGRSQMQRQLDSLELKNDVNRYETQRTAQPQEASPEDQQVRDAHSRLRDLARRQSDLNEQLKSLELSLQKAETQQQREEAARQLRRLREQQQELLRDADELASKLRENSSSESLRQASQQLEKTRENLRQAGESLEAEQPAEALAAGTRAQRDLEELRDDVKRQTSAELSERMRGLQQQAQALSQRQQQLEEQLSGLDTPQDSPGLRADQQSRSDIADGLSQQSDQAAELIEQMREMVRQSEDSQPLLAGRLYESQRQAERGRLKDELKTASELVRRGFDPQAQQLGRSAGAQVDRLAEEIDQAARSVLGDPAEALARASDTLRELADQLAGERDPNSPDDEPTSGESSPGESSQSPSGSAPSGSAPSGQPASGEPSSSESSTEGQSPSGDSSQDQPGSPSPSSGGSPTPGDSAPGDAAPPASEASAGSPSPGSPTPGSAAPGSAAGGGGLLDGQWTQGFAPETRGGAPITGEGYREWTDRLREVEDMLDDAELRSQAAGIRDAARELRRDVTRHAGDPKWSEIERLVAAPLRELQAQVAAEILRRSAEKNAIVPLDRDPVPEAFTEAVRKYYEQLGAGH